MNEYIEPCVIRAITLQNDGLLSVSGRKNHQKHERQRTRCVMIYSNHSAKKPLQKAIPGMGASQELEGYQPKDGSANRSSTRLPGHH